MTSNDQRTARRGFLGDVGIVALHEVYDALKSRWAIVLILLFLIGSVFSTLGSIWFIQRAEQRLAEGMMLEPSSQVGGTATALWKNKIFRDMFASMVGDRECAEGLLDRPPLATFFGLVALMFTPLLVMFTAAPRLAEEVWTGSVRFVLSRTSRPAWCLGKYVGQALLLLVALLLSVPAAWVCGLWKMTHFPAVATLTGMLSFAIIAWIYGLAYLGLATCISLLFRSPRVATAFGLLAYFGSVMVYHLATYFSGAGWRRILDLIPPATPSAYYLDLLSTEPVRFATGAASLALLGLAFLFLGYLRFSRRDL